MAINKNALIRYKTIDRCLQNYHRKWTLDDLIEACSEALYEFEGKTTQVSRRTIQLDIQNMRSEKLGYNAPIEVYEKKYYRYEDPDFSITDIPLTESDMDILTESMEMLKQFKDFSLFAELNGVIQKLEDKIYREKTQQAAIIHIDKNEHLKGLNYLDTLYQAILKKIVLNITYKSFKARDSSSFIFHPYLLKEFNNRWFVVGYREHWTEVQTLALDRILEIDYELKTPYRQEEFDADRYYYHTFGVTVMKDAQLIEVVLWIDQANAPYVLTKPFHHSQELIEQREDQSVVIRLKVHHNFELERLILGFGNAMEVLEPSVLRRRIHWKLKQAYGRYVDKGGEEV